MRLSIRVQIIVACLAVTSPLVVNEIYHLRTHYRFVIREAVSDSREKAEAIAAAASAWMMSLQNGAQVLAEEARLAGGEPGRVQAILDRMARVTRTQASILFILPGGDVAASVPRELCASGVSLSDRSYLRALLGGEEWEIIDLLESRFRGIPVWGLSTAVREGGAFLGAVAVGVPAAMFEGVIPVTMPPGSWSIVDRRGQLVHLNGMGEIPWEGRDRSGQELVRRALRGEEAASEEFRGADGVSRLGAGAPIRPFGWAVEVSRPVAPVLAAASRSGWIEGSIYGGALAIAVLIALFVGRRVGVPLGRLTAAAARLSQGDFTATVEPGGPPELARLMASFNTMVASLDRRKRWDEALKTVGRASTSGRSIDEVLAASLEALMQVSGVTFGLARLVDPESRDLVVASHRGVPAQYLELARRLPWGAGVAGSVAACGEPRILNRPQEQPRFSHLSVLSRWVQSLVCVPLKARGRVIGTLSLGHGQPDFFSPADLPFLLGGASMLAGAILAEQVRVGTQKDAEEKALLFRELDHRIRNNLASLISLLHLGAERAKGTATETLREMADRVARLAEVHNLLAGRGMQPVELLELAERVAKSVFWEVSGHLDIQWRITGHPVLVPSSRLTPLALVLNELLTNCAKHAFPGRATGAVTIQIEREGNEVELTVQDDGVGFDLRDRPPGLGLTIVQALVIQSLGGTTRSTSEGGGRIVCRFPLPLESASGGAA